MLTEYEITSYCFYTSGYHDNVGSYDAPPPESMLVWVGGRYVLCAADIPTLIRGRGEIVSSHTFYHSCKRPVLERGGFRVLGLL